jgi:hypothetical protein
MTNSVSHETLATARIVASAALRRWQRSRSGVDRLLAEVVGQHTAELELQALEARNNAGAL